MRAKIKCYPWIISILILLLTAVPIHAKGDIEKTPESNAKVIKAAYPIQAGISEKDGAGFAKTLSGEADKLLYKLKRKGRDCYTIKKCHS